jgi:hypothetical protein
MIPHVAELGSVVNRSERKVFGYGRAAPGATLSRRHVEVARAIAACYLLFMIVLRPILLASCWLVLTVVGAAAGAAAESCDPAAIIDAYRQAEAAYQAHDFAAAAAQFRPLAEQGLGPAQLRLGEILQAGDKPDPAQVYHWIALAAETHTPGAAAAVTKLTQQVGPAQVALYRFTPGTWRPSQLWSCLAVDPHVTRPDGTQDYDVTRLINHAMAAPTTQRAHTDWLAAALEAIRTRSPRSLIYLKALYGIRLVDGAGPFAVPSAQDKLPLVIVNQDRMDKVSAKAPDPLLMAVITAVHAVLMPEDYTPRTPVTETYKGYTIRTTSDRGGQAFLEFAKKAIDLTDRLPPDLLALARSMTDIRLEPLDAGGAGALAFGTFKRDPKTGQFYMSFVTNSLGRDPGHMTVALTAGGVYLRRATGTARPDTGRTDCELDTVEKRARSAVRVAPLGSRVTAC